MGFFIFEKKANNLPKDNDNQIQIWCWSWSWCRSRRWRWNQISRHGDKWAPHASPSPRNVNKYPLVTLCVHLRLHSGKFVLLSPQERITMSRLVDIVGWMIREEVYYLYRFQFLLTLFLLHSFVFISFFTKSNLIPIFLVSNWLFFSFIAKIYFLST